MLQIVNADCLTYLPTVPDASIDLIVTDPPYPNQKREYGKWTVDEWNNLMDGVVSESKRVLKPNGSAVFILQPNYRHVGEMSLWLWEFLIRTAKNWNLIQDLYWWNYTTPPGIGGANRKYGLTRSSVKYLLWFGAKDCYRNQEAVLWELSDSAKARKFDERARRTRPSGVSVVEDNIIRTQRERGGSTPFNLLPINNADGTVKHGAATPVALAEWLIRYLSKEGDTVLDPFAGVSSIGLACSRLDRSYLGIEKMERYCSIGRQRLGI